MKSNYSLDLSLFLTQRSLGLMDLVPKLPVQVMNLSTKTKTKETETKRKEIETKTKEQEREKCAKQHFSLYIFLLHYKNKGYSSIFVFF